MPKIEVYDAQSAPSGQLRVNRANADDFGAGLGKAAKGAGRKLQEKAERDAAFWVEKTTAQARGDWSKSLQARQQSAELGAPGFTDTLLTDFDEYRNQALESAPTARSRQALDADLSRLRATLTGQAAGFEAASAAQARIAAAQETLTTNTNTVRAEPQMLEDALDQDARLVDALEIPAEEKQKLKTNQRYALGFAAGSGRLDRVEEVEDAQAFADELRSDAARWKARTSETDYARLLARADSLVKQLGARAEAEYTSNFAEAMREIEFGVENGRYTEPEIRDMVADPKTQEAMIRRQAQARETGAAVNAIKLATPEERRAYLAQTQARLARPDAGPEINFDEEVHDLRVRQQAVERVEQALETDAANYVLQVSEPVRKAYQRTIEEQNSPEAVQDFVTAMTAEQRRLRGPDTDVDLLPAAHVASIAVELSAVERTPEGAQQAYERMVVLADTWGKHWPTVMRQLQQAKVLRGTDAVAANLTRPDQRPVGQNLMRAAFIGDKELIKRQGEGFDPKVLDGQIDAALTEFRASTTHQLGGHQVYRDYANSVRTLSLYYMDAFNMGATDAADTAARQVLLDEYQFVGNYRVPRGVSANAVSRSASHIKRTLGEADFDVPLSLAGLDDADSKAAAASILKSEGVWATNGDETGLQLLWPDGTAVEVRDGDAYRPLQFTWDELLNRAPPPPPVRESELTGRNPAMRP